MSPSVSRVHPVTYEDYQSKTILKKHTNIHHLGFEPCSLADLGTFIQKADEGLLQPVEEGDYDRLVSVMGFLMHVKARADATDDMFEPLRETIALLQGYDQELPEEVNVLLKVSKRGGGGEAHAWLCVAYQ